MNKSLHGALFLLAFTAISAFGDEVRLGDFPRGKWLDPVWKAYWVFGVSPQGEDTIRLLDVRDKPVYDFKGIVQNMKTEKLQTGIRLSFECAQAKRSYIFEKPHSGANLVMEIKQEGNSIAYRMDMPTISDTELIVYKKMTIEAETAPKSELTVEQRADRAVDEMLAVAEKADFAELEAMSLRNLSEGLADKMIARLEAEAAKPDAPPSVFIALSTLYGRKGLKTLEYAALNAAETAVKPGVVFNVAFVYGRKQMLAAAPDADAFMVGTLAVQSDPVGAAVEMDGKPVGVTPYVAERVTAGRHVVSLALEGHEPREYQENLGVGQTITVRGVLKAIPKREEKKEEKKPDNAGIPMVGIPRATFYMGSPDAEASRTNSELQHLVRISAFSIAARETTQREWVEVMGSNPSAFKGDANPVENVSWYDIIAYCNKRSLMEGLAPCYSIKGGVDPAAWGAVPEKADADWNRAKCDFSANGYRLPTEAEWEYACRTGLTDPFSTGKNIATDQANYNGNYPYSGAPRGLDRRKTLPVAGFGPNAWGIFDMHGNVAEWCWDCEGMYVKDMLDDPTGVPTGGFRVNRGGGWKNDAQSLRSAARSRNSAYFKANYLGFRVARRP